MVNSGKPDKVYVYNLSGGSLGSWSIDSANRSPTGLTIDPTGASQSIWIVAVSKDRVYEYANARARTSGSQTGSRSFALAAGNTSPQGIADPDGSLRALSAQHRADTNVAQRKTESAGSTEFRDAAARTELVRKAEFVTKSRKTLGPTSASSDLLAALAAGFRSDWQTDANCLFSDLDWISGFDDLE